MSNSRGSRGSSHHWFWETEGGRRVARDRLVNGGKRVGWREGGELIAFIDGGRRPQDELADGKWLESVKIEPPRIHFQSNLCSISFPLCFPPFERACCSSQAGGNIVQMHLGVRWTFRTYPSAGFGFISLGWEKHVEPRQIRSAEQQLQRRLGTLDCVCHWLSRSHDVVDMNRKQIENMINRFTKLDKDIFSPKLMLKKC